jgi:hypothetical protein
MEVNDITGHAQGDQIAAITKIVGKVWSWIAVLLGPEPSISIDAVRIVLASTHVVAPDGNSGLGKNIVVNGQIIIGQSRAANNVALAMSKEIL